MKENKTRRTKKFKNEGNAKLGGLVKELSFQIGLGFAASLEEHEYIGDYATKMPISLLLCE